MKSVFKKTVALLLALILCVSLAACSARTTESGKTGNRLSQKQNTETIVVTDMLGRSHLYNSVPLDAIPALPELIAAGVLAVMVDTTLMNTEEAEAAVARAVRARNVALADGNALAKLEGYTRGHLYRGVSL